MARPLRVLHLEDEALDAELVAATLEAEGLAADFKHVLARAPFAQALRQRDWDLILADYALPGFDGFSALNMALHDCPDVPFIFVSGMMGEDTVAEVLKAGATDCVFKTRLGRLGPAVRRALRETEARVERQRAEAALRQQAARLTGLAEATRVFAEASLDQPALVAAVCQTVAGAIGDGCAVLEPAGLGQWRPPVTVRHIRPDAAALALDVLTAAAQDGSLAQQLQSGPTQPVALHTVAELGAATLPAFRPYVDRFGLRGILIVPLVRGNRVRGLLVAWRDLTPLPYTDDDLAFLQDLADRAALTLETAHLYAAEQRARQTAEQAADRTARLQSVTAGLAKALTPMQAAEVVLGQGVAAMGATAGQVLRLTEDGRHLEAIQTVGYAPAYAATFSRFAVTENLPSADVLRSGEPLLFGSHAEFVAAYPALEVRRPAGSLEAVAVAPLRFEGRAMGTLVLSFRQRMDFTPGDEALLLALAQQCAQALERARLFAQAQQLNTELEERVRARTAALQEANARLEDSREQLRSLSARLQAAREDERARIARDVHEDLGQQLTGVMMDLSWVQKRLPADQPALEAKARNMADLLNHAIRSVRQITSDLRPSLLDDLGLVPALEWQLQDFETRTGMQTELDTTLTDLALPPENATAIFRIFQETLANVARHAQATRVVVRLDQQLGQARLTVTDNGRGISAAELSDPHSLGLLSMRERVRVFGGELAVEGAPGAGTTVIVTMPAAPAPDRDASSR